MLRRSHMDGLHATAIPAVATCVVYLTLVRPQNLLSAPWHEILWQGTYQGVC